MRIIVLAVGRLRPPFVDDVQHYDRLLSRHTRVDVIELRDGEQVAGRVPARAFTCLLGSEGRALDSIGWASLLEERRQSGRDLCFVLGGPYGLELEHADMRVSLGSITLPHQLARVVLLEQLYRAHKILAGEPYHH